MGDEEKLEHQRRRQMREQQEAMQKQMQLMMVQAGIGSGKSTCYLLLATCYLLLASFATCFLRHHIPQSASRPARLFTSWQLAWKHPGSSLVSVCF